MTVETVKRKLKSVRNLKVRLMALQQRINELAEEIDGLSATDYSKEKVKASNSNSVEDRYIMRADRLKDLQDQYNAIFEDLCVVEDELGERMKRLNPTEYQVIKMRYLEGIKPYSIKRVANKLGYTYESIQKVQQRAFKKMSDEPPPK